jgi:hypothetical protein
MLINHSFSGSVPDNENLILYNVDVLKVYSKAFQFPSGIKLEHLLSCE